MPDNVKSNGRKRAIVIGGSMAGLFSAILLDRAGWDVNVFERSGEAISDRGTGFVTHAELFDVLQQCGVDTGAAKVGVTAAGRRIFERDGRISAELELPQVLTSWGHLYGLLRNKISSDKYHYHRSLSRLEQGTNTVTAYFDDGSRAEGELLIGADGIFSTVRAQLAPDVTPSYAGYVAWRGLVKEGDLSDKTREELCDYFAFSLPEGEQMLGYPVAGEGEVMERGRRRYNIVWYRPADGEVLRDLLTDSDGISHVLSVPPNKIRSDLISLLRRTAKEILSPQFAEAVERVQSPFIQVIQDLIAPKMRLAPSVVILGDAASVARPHVGMGVTKAAGDAAALVEKITSFPDDLSRALDEFSDERQKFGAVVVQHARKLGAYMQAQHFTEDERMYAERHRKPEAVMAETAAAIAIRL